MHKTALLLALLAFASGCRNKDKIRVQTEEEPPRLAAMLTMGDPRSASQLLLGFYPVEQSGWRWTAGKFSVLLRPPRDAAQMGAVLKFKFSIPPPVMDRVKETKLTAYVGDTKLPPETYSKAGEYEFIKEVPAAAFTSDSLKVDFALSKFLEAGVVEGRELGVIAVAVGFEHK